MGWRRIALTGGGEPSYAEVMEIKLPTELEGRLDRMAEQQGRDRGSLVVEAVERLVSHEAWFAGEVEKGLAELEQERVLSHAEAGARLEKRLSRRRTA